MYGKNETTTYERACKRGDTLLCRRRVCRGADLHRRPDGVVDEVDFVGLRRRVETPKEAQLVRLLEPTHMKDSTQAHEQGDECTNSSLFSAAQARTL